MTTLRDILTLLRREDLLVDAVPAPPAPEEEARWASVAVTGADCDSRLVEPGHVFFCKGLRFQPRFLTGAIEAGAVLWIADEAMAATIVEALGTPSAPGLVVSDVRVAMALVSAEAWGHPDRALKVVGITGTKGKTTTAHYLRSILEGAGMGCAFMGTHEFFDGFTTYEAPNTTPEAPELWRILARAREAGLASCVMEVSSQSLKYDRTLGLELAVAGFLNIGNDHISPLEHPTYEDYLASKLRIFSLARSAVVNLGTDELDRVLRAAEGIPLTTCAVLLEGDDLAEAGPARGADYLAHSIVARPGQTSFVARTPEGEVPVKLAMDGVFNVENALCALALAGLLGVDGATAARALATARVPGRMETFRSDDGRFTGIVDYAHNDLSYRRFFETVEAMWPGASVVSAFGVSGGKALDRYEDLPRIASEHSDAVVLTSDDPGDEDPEELLALMAPHVASGVPCVGIADREAGVDEAFRQALERYERGETVVLCILGKGRENSIYAQGRDVPIENDALHVGRLMVERGLSSPGAAPTRDPETSHGL